MNIGGEFNIDLENETKVIDRLKTDLEAVKVELFPDTAVNSISDYERTRGIVPLSNSTLNERRSVVVAKEASGGARKFEHFYAIAAALGYNDFNINPSAPFILITDGNYLGFTVGDSIVGEDCVGDDSFGFNKNAISVDGTNVESDLSLQTAFESARLVGTTFVYKNQSAG